MPNEPTTLKPATDPTVMENLLIAIDEKTESLMALRELLRLLETEQSELGKALLDALSMMTTELGANRSIRHMQMDALNSIEEQREELDQRLSALERQDGNLERKLDRILRILNLPMS
tara:strand:+ start:193 stop:546 length:354 start_codon:yes stop_codon:yes gene_type:complete